MNIENLVIGVNPVKEALSGNREVFELFVQNSATDHRLESILKKAHERGIAVHRRERENLTKLCGSSHHQGVVLHVAPFPYCELEDLVGMEGDGFLLVLDGIQDPHNLGALIRTAACAGATGVVLPKDRACGITATVEKSSAGAVETIPVARVTNICKALEFLKSHNYWVYGLAGEAGSSLYSINFSGNIVLVVGSEGDGIRQLVKKQCDGVVAIPHYGGVGSLNASVAGGIAMFEVARKRSA